MATSEPSSNRRCAAALRRFGAG